MLVHWRCGGFAGSTLSTSIDSFEAALPLFKDAALMLDGRPVTAGGKKLVSVDSAAAAAATLRRTVANAVAEVRNTVV